MTDIADLGIRIDSSPAARAAKELDKLTVSATRAEDAAQDLAVVSRGPLVTGMSAGGQQSRMMAMQLSQVAQQASATGNFVQALAIQLPDMATGFGTVGIAAGVLASVTLPLLVSAFGDTRGEADAANEALGRMDEAVNAFTAAAEAASAPTADLIEKYGALAGVAREALSAMTDVAQIEAINSVADAIAAVNESLTEDMGRGGLQLADSFGLARDASFELLTAIKALNNAQGLEAQARAALQVQQAMLAAFGSVDAMPRPIRDAFAAMGGIATKSLEAEATLSKMPGLLNAAANAAASAAGAVDGIGAAASNAFASVAALVGKMQEMAAAQAAVGSGRGDTAGGPVVGSADLAAIQAGGGVIRNMPAPSFGGGGGGGGSDPFQSDLQALIENLRSERAIEDEWYQESLAILNDRRAEEILGKEAHDAALLSLHQEYQDRIAQIDADAAQRRISETAGLFGALASVAQAGGEKSAKAVATFQAIEGTINAYGAALKALNTPGLTLAGRIAAYASVLGAGLRGVAAIRAAGGVGGGRGGGGGATIAAQGVTSQPQGQNIAFSVYGLERDAVYSGAFIERIFAGLMEEGRRRGMNTQTVQFL